MIVAELKVLAARRQSKRQAGEQMAAVAGDQIAESRLWIWRMASPTSKAFVYRAFDRVAICDYRQGHRIIVVDPQAQAGVAFAVSDFSRLPVDAVLAMNDDDLIRRLLRAAGNQPGCEVVRALFAHWEALELAAAAHLPPGRGSSTSAARQPPLQGTAPRATPRRI